MDSLRSVPAPVLRHSSRSAPSASEKQVPAELVSEILQYLDQSALWRAAAVSRAFYASAWHAGLYIHRKLFWDSDANCNADLTVLGEIVRHTLHHDLRLSLSFASPSAAKYVSATDDAGDSSLTLTKHILEILAQVTDSLPVLVFLSLGVSESFWPSIGDALRHPAPRLESFYLSLDPETELVRYIVPNDLFSGVAPRLRRVTLRNVSLGLDRVSAFSRVFHAEVYHDHVFPDIDFSRHFPSVRSLRLEFNTIDSPQRPRFKLDGIVLQKLVIGEVMELSLIPSLDRSIELCGIPIIEYDSYEAEFIDWTEPIWRQKTRSNLSIRLMHPTFPESPIPTSVHIVPEHPSRNWRRTCRLYAWTESSRCPIIDMPDICHYLTYLRMDNIFLICLLEGDGFTLDALRNLQIDFKSEGRQAAMVWPPDWLDALDQWHRQQVSYSESDRSAPTFDRESYSHVHCRNLETITLFALDATMCVESQEAAFLGRALSQITRPEKDRAALVLVGVEFHKPVAHTLLGQTFSFVRYLDFAGLGSLADKDGDLWVEGV